VKKESIRNKFFRFFLIMGIIPSLLVILILYFGISRHLEQQTGKNLKSLAVETSLRVDMFLQNKIDNILKYSTYSTIKRIFFPGNNQDITSEFIRSLFKFDTDLYNIAILNLDLNLLTSYRPNIEFMHKIELYSDRLKGLKNKEIIIISTPHKNTDKDKFHIITPLISDINHKKMGLLVATFNLNRIEKLIERISVSGKYYLCLISPSGKILASTNKSLKNSTIPNGVSNIIYKQNQGWTIYMDSYLKQESLIGFSTITNFHKLLLNDKSFYIYVSTGKDEAFKPIFSLLIKLSGLSLCLVLSILYFLTSKINNLCQPIVSLKESAEMMGKGQFRLISFTPTGDELDDLANSFNRMGESLQISGDMLEEQNQRLIKLNNIKNDFISMVSHELRTPLMIIKEALSQILDGLKGDVPPSQKDFLNMAYRNTNRLNQIIHDLLSISEIERGKMRFKRKKSNLIKILNDEINNQMIKCDEKHISLIRNFDCNNLETYCDPDKIQIIITNLLGNAIKFTPKEGKISIAVNIHKDKVEVSVSDNGPGIPAESIEKIFERFFRLNSTPLVGAPSTGLGLAIAKELIEMHNGKIWVTSDGKNGSTFNFTLPRYMSEEFVQIFLTDQIENALDKNQDLTIFNLFTGYYHKEQILDSKDQLKEIYLEISKFDFQYLFDSFEIIYLEKESEIFIISSVKTKKAHAINRKVRETILNTFNSKNIFDKIYINIVSATLNTHGKKSMSDIFKYLKQLRADIIEKTTYQTDIHFEESNRREHTDRRKTSRRE